MNIPRSKIQEFAMVLIYDTLIFVSCNIAINVEDMLVNFFDLPYQEINVFIKEAMIKSLKNKEAIVAILQSNLPNWNFYRLNRLAQAILLLAVTHYRYIEKVDKKIVIDNAVRLAKKYLDEGDYRLINAVLDKTL